MEACKTSRQQRRVIWGAFLVLTGVLLLLLGQLTAWDISWHQWWPLLLVAGGFAKLLAYPRARKVAKGFFLSALGSWMLVCNLHLWGLSYANSWPVLFIAAGVALVLSSALQMRANPIEVSSHAR